MHSLEGTALRVLLPAARSPIQRRESHVSLREVCANGMWLGARVAIGGVGVLVSWEVYLYLVHVYGAYVRARGDGGGIAEHLGVYVGDVRLRVSGVNSDLESYSQVRVGQVHGRAVPLEVRVEPRLVYGGGELVRGVGLGGRVEGGGASGVVEVDVRD